MPPFSRSQFVRNSHPSTPAGLALITWRYLYLGLFTNVDEIASMLQARYMAAGDLAGGLRGHEDGRAGGPELADEMTYRVGWEADG